MTGKPKSGKSLLQTGHIYLKRIFIDILRGSPKRGAQSLLCHSLIRMSHQLTKDGPLILCQKDGPSLQEKSMCVPVIAETSSIKNIPVDFIPPQQVLDSRQKSLTPAWLCEKFICANPQRMDFVFQCVS